MESETRLAILARPCLKTKSRERTKDPAQWALVREAQSSTSSDSTTHPNVLLGNLSDSNIKTAQNSSDLNRPLCLCLSPPSDAPLCHANALKSNKKANILNKQ